MGEEIVPTYAIIPTYNKAEQLAQLLQSLSHTAGVIVIDNGDEDFITRRDTPVNTHVIRASAWPPNLSKMWNAGLDIVQAIARVQGFDRWNVAVLNDDVVLPDHRWCERISEALRETNAATACGVIEPETTLLTERSPWTLSRRLCGWAHVSRGELGLRFDEDLKWWFGDTAYDKEARRVGGLLLVGEEYVTNTDADVSTHTNPELLAQAGRDRQTYIQKWGNPGW